MSDRPDPLDPGVRAKLERVSTATLCTQLLARGLRKPFMDGPKPIGDSGKLVGVAFTVRYAPAREDLGMSVHFDNRTDIQRLAVESIGDGEVFVIDARGETSAGTLGNILATRIRQRGGVGVVSDGAVRDAAAMSQIGMPVYASGANARLSSVLHRAVDMGVPVGCGRVLVCPGDVIVGDGDGVVVIPREWASEVAAAAVEQEELEQFILGEISSGRALDGVYPAGPDVVQAFEQSKSN